MRQPLLLLLRLLLLVIYFYLGKQFPNAFFSSVSVYVCVKIDFLLSKKSEKGQKQ